MCRRRCRSGPRWPGLAPVSCARRPERPIEHAVSLRAKEVGLCGVHGVLCGSPTLARSTDYAAIRPRSGARLRITTDSASSALCGAPHNAEFERELIALRRLSPPRTANTIAHTIGVNGSAHASASDRNAALRSASARHRRINRRVSVHAARCSGHLRKSPLAGQRAGIALGARNSPGISRNPLLIQGRRSSGEAGRQAIA